MHEVGRKVSETFGPAQCCLCGATEKVVSARFHQIYPQKNSQPALLDWWECRVCRGWFVHPYPLPEMIESHWKTVAYNDPAYQITIAGFKEGVNRRILKGLSERIKPGPLLDFGCNFGQLMGKAREAGWSPSGFEPYKKAVELARTKGFDVRCGWSLQEADFVEEHFAAITANDVFALVSNPLATLKTFHLLLRPGGVLAMRLTNKRLILGFVRALSKEGPLRNAQISKILQAQFHSIGLHSLSGILRDVGFDFIRIQAHATTAPWNFLGWRTRIAYVGADLVYLLSFGKINVSPGILLFARKAFS